MPAADPNEDLGCPSSPLSEANNTSSSAALQKLNETCYEDLWGDYDVKILDLDINHDGKDAICKDISQEYLKCQGETCGKRVLKSGGECLRYAWQASKQFKKEAKQSQKDTEQPQKDPEQSENDTSSNEESQKDTEQPQKDPEQSENDTCTEKSEEDTEESQKDTEQPQKDPEQSENDTCTEKSEEDTEESQKDTEQPQKDPEQSENDTCTEGSEEDAEQPQKAAEKSPEKFIDFFSECFQKVVNGPAEIEAAFSAAVGVFNSCQKSRTKCDSELRKSANVYMDSQNPGEDGNCRRHISQSIQPCTIFLFNNKPLDGSIEKGFRDCVNNRVETSAKDKECSVEDQNIEG
ncbi:alpha/beta hydrolase [Metarhizium robertsii ARSEF 23]|uniref:Alpha/beta hydrolase n=1 Tax=Metarhizium robertsii (strain ARSEF 23 / ATCC MYA-3075) TaxID=655844 RepID=A0A0B2XIQ6_METRA|nr:alpha/beta hydrolase [Metarhizium robertsii ARSEF 23]KHO11809.1 alpha/beta hydrolase [Metarhizium robertsii ARSEF 23]